MNNGKNNYKLLIYNIANTKGPGFGPFLQDFTIKELNTERLILKPLRKEEDQNLFELHSDPDVMKYIRAPEQDIFETKKKVSTILKYTQENPHYGLWCAYTKDTDKFIGWVILLHIEHNESYPIEVGYRLHQKYWRQGFATDMTLAMIQYAKEIGLGSLCAITTEENIGSQKVLEKTGFSYLEERLYYETQVKYYEIKL